MEVKIRAVYDEHKGRYIHYYNHERIKLGLKGLSPVEYRLKNTA